MTKDFNQQGRDDVRPSSRNPSSSRHGQERSPRPARPRLNRQTVDRAWEAGARHEHADYHTRSQHGQPPRDNWRRNQYSPSAHNSRRPYGDQQDNYQRSERTPNRNSNPRAQSLNSQTRHSEDRYPGNRRSYSDRPDRMRSRPGPGFRDNEQHREFRDRNQGYERRESERDNRSPGNFERGNRSPRDYQQRNIDRRQSRPMTRNDDQPRGRQDFSRRERFEGDYERFETPEPPRPSVSRSAQSNPHQETEQRHVTRLPDGRVLKGPRPAQRKDAQFWTEVAHDAEALVEPVHPSLPVSDTAPAPTGDDEPKARRKPRTRTEGAANRGKKARGKQNTAKPPSSGPKPSERGFKWPTS